MALVGPWGTFLWIPKCGGASMRAHLITRYSIALPREDYVNGPHGLPDDFGNAFAIVRHPVDWLCSFYAYYAKTKWNWPDLPDYIRDLFADVAGLDWVNFVSEVEPGIVGRVFDYYCQPGVMVYKLEEIFEHFPTFPHLHRSEGKPDITHLQREFISRKEAVTIERYGYAEISDRTYIP